MKTINEIPEATSGSWRVERFEIPKFSIEGLRLAMKGRPASPGTYTRLMRGGTLVMSNTPAELDDLHPLFHAIGCLPTQRVLINGLGLGVALLGVLQMKVSHIDVVEQSEDVLSLVSPHYKDERVTFHHADALTKTWPKGTRWDVVWHDIWDNVPNEDDLPTISKLKRAYGRRCHWQGVWCEQHARR